MNGRRSAAAPATNDIRNPPPLHCLLAFEAAGRSASLAKAAGELRLTASAVAQSIAVLEDRIGLKLARSLVPVVDLTAAGERYLRSVQAFSMDLRDGLFEQSSSSRSQLRVTAPQALGRIWLAPLLVDFTRRHPRIDLVLTCTERFEPVRGGVDVALRSGGTDGEGLVSLPLWSDTLVAAAAPALAAQAEGLSPADVAATLPLIDHPVANWQRWLADIGGAPAEIRALVVCTDLHMAIEAALQGMGVVIAPSRLLAQWLQRRELRRVSVHSTPALSYRAVVSAEQHQRPTVRAFLGWLQQHC